MVFDLFLIARLISTEIRNVIPVSKHREQCSGMTQVVTHTLKQRFAIDYLA